MSWSARISPDYAMKVQNLAEHARSLAGWARPDMPLEDVHAINAELGKIKREIQRIVRLGQQDVREDAQERREVARQVEKYRTAQLRVAHAAAMDADETCRRLRLIGRPVATLPPDAANAA